MNFNINASKMAWVAYGDGSFEPANEKENINLKPRGRGGPDWWVVSKEPDWRPPKYADTKRGRKAALELGAKRQDQRSGSSFSEAWDKTASKAKKPKVDTEGGTARSAPANTPRNATDPAQTMDDRPFQYQNTGKATIQLGGPDKGKVTVLDDLLDPVQVEPQ